MVGVSARDLGSVTRALRSMLPVGRQRLHFSSEGDARRRQILTALIASQLWRRRSVRPTDEVETKNRLVSDVSPSCWLSSTQTWPCSFWTVEGRTGLNDRRVLRGVMRASGRDLPTYSHRGSSDEPLLALPDALGWAVGAGGHFAKQVAASVHEIFLSDEIG